MARARTLAYVGALGRAVRLATKPGGPTLGERAVAVPRLVAAVRSGEYTGTSLGKLGLVAAGAAYVVSPVDLLPESVLGVLGVADDAMVLGWVATTLVEETEKFLEWEKQQGRGPGRGPTVPSDVVG
ncbi:YkvA family protein [Phycicoccus avicenniae]|uniref:YkvA family protein n=1 Tax=Phycicoccus avicenniae TaxID=2828860 RepID=UPI003D27C4E0